MKNVMHVRFQSLNLNRLMKKKLNEKKNYAIVRFLHDYRLLLYVSYTEI